MLCVSICWHIKAQYYILQKTTAVYACVCMCTHACVCVCVCVCVSCIRRKENYLANQKLTFSFKTSAGNIMGVSQCGSYFFNCINFEAVIGVQL